jgi:cyanophycinase-like exopeptidase
MAMTSWAPHVRDFSREPDPGLGLFPSWRVLPHFDRIPDFDPGMLKRAVDELPDDRVLIGIDEETALVRLDGSWAVYGRQAVHVFRGDSATAYRAGEIVPV